MITMDGASLRFGPKGELTIYHVEEATKALAASFARAKDILIDLSPTDKIDTAARLAEAPRATLGEEMHHRGAEFSGAAENACDEKNWTMKLAFSPEVMEHGFEPVSFLAHLRKNSGTFDSSVDTSAVPLIASLEPTTCYISFDLRFTTTPTSFSSQST